MGKRSVTHQSVTSEKATVGRKSAEAGQEFAALVSAVDVLPSLEAHSAIFTRNSTVPIRIATIYKSNPAPKRHSQNCEPFQAKMADYAALIRPTLAALTHAKLSIGNIPLSTMPSKLKMQSLIEKEQFL
jgi:hypothetical protein